MADFLPAFERMILNEGGYKLTNVKDDRGGQTYAGIARRRWTAWTGWQAIDRGETPDSDLVRKFYFEKFWMQISGDHIDNQQIAENIFDFAVNAGVATSAKVAQIVCRVTPDGKIGPKTLASLNGADAEMFRAEFALAKIARYRDIVVKDRSQLKFFLGWINRTLKEAT